METNAAEGVVLAGRYRVESLLGQGGMAEVYGGWDLRLQRPVAIKLLRPGLSADASLRARFEREARAAARLTHPNVVAVFDAGEDSGRAYIVMERLDGESLADGIARGPLDLAWLRRVGSDVLDALGAAHRAGIIHRDIKPANVLIGTDGRAKVADFGIASVIEEQAAAAFDGGLTAAGTLVGTPAYVAPERVFGQPATPQSDLYAVGVVLYEALTGRKPFDGTTPVAIATAASQATAVDPLSLRPDADQELVEVIARAMAFDPAQRYPSASAMGTALQLPEPSTTEVFPLPGLLAQASTEVIAEPSAVIDPIARPPEQVATVALPAEPEPAAIGLALPRGGPRSSWRQRRLVAVVAGVVVLAALVAAAVASQNSGSTAIGAVTTTSARSTSTTSSPIQALLVVASQLTAADGSAAPQLATGLQQLAALAPAAKPAAASKLLGDANRWRQQGQLTAAAYSRVVALLTSLGGTISTPAPTSAPTPTPVRRKGKGGKGGH